MAKVVILMGSKSDEKVMKRCARGLDHFGIPYHMKILSAHRQPNETAKFAQNAAKNGYEVIIAAAGMAAHLPGAVASQTTLPVIGVPLNTSELNGLDSLLSIVQMPSGIPVATVAVGGAGAHNAAVLAAQILALKDDAIRRKLIDFKKRGAKF
ncbi:MAG TPA: 5-(carboxyamino)imidazole ribonucleotide mutase [Rhodothermia bacterium]|nr:5-(carboxyamino)imidazole ribonucleotide mutase [Rhodothermia bacterium]